MDYKNKWQENSLNIDFWKEVLVGRMIVDLEFEEYGIESLILDNGEKIYPYDSTIFIKTEEEEYLSSDKEEPFVCKNPIKLSGLIANLPEGSYISNYKWNFNSPDIITEEPMMNFTSKIIKND